jgi:hypothetical protein
VNQVPEIHCENCGRTIRAGATETLYCLECGLYVCLACWDRSRELCLDCATRPRQGIRIRTARRADRRLREVVKQAIALALRSGTRDDDEAWIEHACLGIKAETAARGGFRAWSRLRGERAERARPLGDRIRRHAYEADTALERAGVALLRRGLDNGNEILEQTTAAVRQRPRAIRRIIRRAPAGAAVLLVAAVVAAVMVGGPLWLLANDDGPSARQGTLAGNQPGPPPSVAPPPVAEETAAATSPDAILMLDFDRERMGQGIGAGWVQTAGPAGSVALAPFPTAVNRSARLESADAAGAEACRAVGDASVRVIEMTVDVLLEDPDATAALIGRNAAGSPVLQVNLGTSGSTFAAGSEDRSARADGPRAGAWARTEVAAVGEQTLWRVTRETSGVAAAQTVDVSSLADIEQVCLAASAGSNGAAYFDNLTIATVEEG